MFLDHSRVRSAHWPNWLHASFFTWLLMAAATAFAQPQDLRLDFSPANTTVNFTLGDIIHTVHGSFKLKQGDVEYNLATAAVRGALVIDATSGQSGNHSRDRKMHREILESAQYPEITFRPDRVDGTVAPAGTSTVQVHGTFTIHGADHELTMPVRVEVFPDHWIADTHFTIPYVKWGIKNPSTFVLRVSESVGIEVHATGSNPFGNAGAQQFLQSSLFLLHAALAKLNPHQSGT